MGDQDFEHETFVEGDIKVFEHRRTDISMAQRTLSELVLAPALHRGMQSLTFK